MSTTLHPGVEPAATALDELAPAPTDTAEYADILKSLNDLTGPCLLASLDALLDRLASQAASLPDVAGADRSLIAEHLEAAAELLAPVAERIDRARALTGWWS